MLEAYEKWTVRDMPQVDYAQEEAYYEDERAQSNHYLGMAVLLAGVGVAGYFVYQHYLAPKASGTTTTVKRTAPTPTHKPKKATAPVKTTSRAATGPKAPSPSQIKFTLSQCTLLQYGSQGQAVKMLQEAIWSLGFNPLGIDGIFGPNTEAAVKRFQAAMHISVDGIAGPQTYGALNRALASHGGYWKCRTASYYSGTSSTRATGSVSSLPLLEVGSTGTLVRKVHNVPILHKLTSRRVLNLVNNIPPAPLQVPLSTPAINSKLHREPINHESVRADKLPSIHFLFSESLADTDCPILPSSHDSSPRLLGTWRPA